MADDEDRSARKHTSSRYAFTNRSANGAAMNRKRRATMTRTKHIYEVRPRKDHRGVAAISDALPFIIALIVGGVLVFILLYFGSFLVTRRQDGRLRSSSAQR